MNDYAFVLDKIRKCEEVKRLLEMLLMEKRCKFYFMDDVYEEYCKNPKSKPNKKKFPYDFKPERDCVECKYYER